MTNSQNKSSLMRNIGEFFGHIIKAVRSDPKRKVIRKQVEEEKQGEITLRRTTIEEIEINPDTGRRN